MTEAEQRAAVVAEARSWVGTPYHHGQAVKRRGCDCGKLLRAVYVACGVVPDFETPFYSADQMFHVADEFIVGLVQGCGAVEVTGPPLPGDVVLWRHGLSFSHCGIATDWPHVVHAFAREGAVSESDASKYRILGGKQHPIRIFSPWGSHP
jgi:cell wall-associated NlpC family hydrolase